MMRIDKKSQVHQLVMGIVTIAVVLGVGMVVMQQVMTTMNVTTTNLQTTGNAIQNVQIARESDPSFQTQQQPDSSIGSDSAYSKQITQQYLDWKDGGGKTQSTEPIKQTAAVPTQFWPGISIFALIALVIPVVFIIWFFWLHRF